jgi:hypothetical protein
MGEKPLKCSFCKKSQTDVIQLIAGKRVYICNECVDSCAQKLAEAGYYSKMPVKASDESEKKREWPDLSKSAIRYAKTSYALKSAPSKEWIRYFLSYWKEWVKLNTNKLEIRFDGKTIILVTDFADRTPHQYVIDMCMRAADDAIKIEAGNGYK